VIYTIRSLVGSADCQSGPDSHGRWSRAIPLPFYGGYLAAAWAVLRGNAVAVRYPTSGELEQALQDTGGIHVSASLQSGKRQRPREHD
jgi:hypothetical protein